MKKFNTTGICIPEKHYMVDISDRLDNLRIMIDDGEYFCINRARQYGKTTTLAMLKKALSEQYVVISMDFQEMSQDDFKTSGVFVQAFSRLLRNKKKTGLTIPENIDARLSDYAGRTRDRAGLSELFETLSDWCAISESEIVLIIDEVDSASNNQVFLDFLSQLRSAYIARDSEGYPAFKSVILAGVTDIKHLRSKVRSDEQHKVNSPWNISADFNLDMSLSEEGIRCMLGEYEYDHNTGMDTSMIARMIREYTSGYPYLVSRICQIIDEAAAGRRSFASEPWSVNGLQNAVTILLNEKNTLFESLTGKLTNYPNMKQTLHSILMEGVRIPYNSLQEAISELEMHGLIMNREGSVSVSNRIFETLLYNLFLSEDELNNNVFGQQADLGKSIFINNGNLNMPLIMEHFIRTYTEICGPLEERFLEKDGRELFLLYLKPIINGTGNYYIEAQTRDQKRMDIVVDYLGHQYIIELKIWRGDRYNALGEQQISDYLDYFGLNTGYMLSFNFTKHKKVGVERIQIGDKVIFEGTL